MEPTTHTYEDQAEQWWPRTPGEDGQPARSESERGEPASAPEAAGGARAADAPEASVEPPSASMQDEGAHDLQAHLEQADQLLGTLRVRFDDLRERDAATRRRLAESERETERLRGELAERDAKLFELKRRLGELSAGL